MATIKKETNVNEIDEHKGHYLIRVFRDGSRWCALIGDDLQLGMAGFERTPIIALFMLMKIMQKEKDRLRAFFKPSLPFAAQRWTAQPPESQGYFWHWNGVHGDSPMPTYVMFSGTDESYFVTAGQLGLTRAIDVSEYGGLWLIDGIETPDTSTAEIRCADEEK
jgi:hypothetical protein